MKNLRAPVFRKAITAFFLINFLGSVFLPNYSFALTGGPHQIEYTSYEEPGATDMVNLLTGDFTYNLPILDIPGPEGSFSLPLSYHAGIGLDQEASWVGLGWTMNPGAIVRNINEYPDDAKGEAHSVTVQDLNVIRGWDSNLTFLRLGWNNQVGHYGSVSLSIKGIGVHASWGEGQLQSLGISAYGVSVSNHGIKFDPVSFALSVFDDFIKNPTNKVDPVVVNAYDKANAIAGYANLVNAAFRGGDAPKNPTAGVWKPTNITKQKFFHKEYKIWLDHTRTEDMYGTLYMGSSAMYTAYQQSTNLINLYLTNGGTSQPLDQFVKSSGGGNKGSASDVNYHIDNGKEYYEVNNPSALAYDDYQVNAPGIGGSISPYRFDVGSVSMPREMTAKHNRLAPVKWQNYKVPFIYEGLPANSYFHHVGSPTTVSAPTPHFGVSHSVGSTNVNINPSLTYNLNDVVLKNDRIRSDINTSKKIPLPNHVEWYNNGEIKTMTTHATKFIDFLYGSGVGSDRYNFRDHFTSGQNTSATTSYSTSYNFTNIFQVDAALWNVVQAGTSIVNIEAVIYNDATSHANGTGGQQIIMTGLMVQGKYSTSGSYSIAVSSHSYFTIYAGKIADVEITHYINEQNPDAIGGYMITANDGTSYHFALPVYDYNTKTEIIDATDSNKRSILSRKDPFANTWLLTAITYPDYIDRNNNGVADAEDWGGWIKLNYGRHSDKYDWRAPYENYKRDPSNKTDSYSSGSKQLYYLNSIETRSHVALFLKSNRSDGKSKNNTYPLRLDEIVVLSQEHYNKLKTTYFIPQYSNKINVLCLSNTFNTGSRDFMDKNSIKRVKFTYSYELCPGIPNSTAGGKLTLKNISIFGRGSNNKLIPDYKFEYSNNQSYSEHKWDGWGMYNPSGTQSGQTHMPSQSSSTANAWSLSKIITPLGAEIEVNLERDVYNSVSGETVMQHPISFVTTNVNRQYFGPTSLGLIDNVNHYGSIQAGDNVKLEGNASFLCPTTGHYQHRTFNGTFYVTGVSANTISINADFVGTGCTPSYGSTVYFEYIQGTIRKVEYDYKGGDVRVHSIVMKDEFGIQNKIRYLYTKADGKSSGVIGKQNPYVKFDNFAFENIPEMPGTPVMYSRVSVLNGNLVDDNDFHTRTVYEFETPHKNLIVSTHNTIIPETKIRDATISNLFYKDYVILKEHIIHNYTAKIGSLKSTRVYDKNGVLKSSTDMVYTNQLVNDVGNAYQGIYTQGTIMADRIEKAEERTWYHKFNRTTILRYANVLKEVINSKDGNTGKSENTKWDFITGNVLEKVETSPLGLKVKSVTVPAYKLTPYAEFGPKAVSLSNKNMLSQVAAEYSYLLDASGAEVGLLGASAQTWKKDWNNYRIYSGGTYTQGSEGDQVWRKSSSYVWRGDYNRLRTDGSHTFAAGDKFNFNSLGSNPGWEYVGEPLRYDHYSMTLESKDRNNIYASSKMGYDNRIKILSASNAEYTEVAFSSAEDYDAITGHFGGEVALKSSGGNAAVIKKSTGGDSHTGDCAIQLSSGYGFVYKPTGLKTNQKYRASVWTKSTNGRIYYKLNGGGEVLSSAPTTATKAGNWYLINFEIPIGASFSSLEVGVKSTSGTVQFDDFRFQPIDASMVCYVYNPLTHELSGTNLEYSEYVLDNDNLYTRYEYNAKGQLHKTFRESIKYNGEKLVSESTSDYRRFYINQ